MGPQNTFSFLLVENLHLFIHLKDTTKTTATQHFTYTTTRSINLMNGEKKLLSIKIQFKPQK